MSNNHGKPTFGYGLNVAIMAAMVLMAVPPGVAHGGEVKVEKSVCEGIIGAVPATGGAYEPGVDVNGDKVAGADLGGAPAIKIPDEISFDYGIDLEKKYGLGGSGSSTGNPVIGKVTIRDGKVLWNDRPIDGGDQAAIAAECRRVYGK